MSRKRRPIEFDDEPQGRERWLLTYSDMITLLLALFVVLYGMNAVNNKNFAQVSEIISESLNNVTNDTEEGTLKLEDYNLTLSELESHNALNNIYSELDDYIKDKSLDSDIELVKEAGYISVNMKDSVLFQPNTAQLLPESVPILTELSEVISDVYSSLDHITITGNTADLGDRDPLNEADSWQLSVDRAVRVLNSLTEYGLEADKLSIEGNSHYNPVAPNDTEEGRAKNRRVEITITTKPK